MTEEDIVWEVKSDYIRHLAENKKRIDERKLDEYRKIEVTPGYVTKHSGSALVKLGGTQVLVGVSFEMGEPYPDTPDAGVLITNSELVPLADPSFESGPPREGSIELSRVVDRGIRESKAMDFGKLCIEPGEKVWLVFLDLHVLDYDGNLFDASELASTAALLNAELPKYEDGKVIRDEGSGKKLPITKKPVECTFAKIGNTVMLDPCLEEEKSLDARITFATVEDGLCAIQKGGNGPFTEKEISEAMDLAFKRGKDLRKLLK
jgi:exosome complex component RRP42